MASLSDSNLESNNVITTLKCGQYCISEKCTKREKMNVSAVVISLNLFSGELFYWTAYNLLS